MEKKKAEKTREKRPGFGLPITLLAILLVLGIGSMFSETGEEQLEKGDFLPYWQATWLPMCVLAIAISWSLHGLVYGVGHALNSEPIKRYAFSELLQTAATAVIVIALTGILVQAFDFVGSIGAISCGEEQISAPIEADMCRTDEFRQELVEKKKYAFDADKGPEILYSTRISIFSVPVFVGSWIKSVHKEVETYHSIAYICTNLLIGLSAKMFILQYIRENMLTVFLPIGIILRTFHFTRGIGALFISLAIAFFFIYPTVVFMMDSSFMEANAGPALPEILTTGMCNIPIFGSFSFGSAAIEMTSSSGAASQIALSNNLASFIADIQTELIYSNMVGFSIALTFVRFATTILGGDVTPFMGMVGRLV
ncbi:hypothetical protein JW721_01145 [Candidatus Micrarchaeota archaeon]|nr:hypothetical protein [Candidatus Micrarchaeota archaeon]